MAFSSLFKAEGQQNVYDVAKHPIIDLIKEEPVDENNKQDDGNEEIEPEINNPSLSYVNLNSSLPMEPNCEPSVHFTAPLKVSETEFQLKFSNHSGDKTMFVNKILLVYLTYTFCILTFAHQIFHRFPIIPLFQNRRLY